MENALEGYLNENEDNIRILDKGNVLHYNSTYLIGELPKVICNFYVWQVEKLRHPCCFRSGFILLKNIYLQRKAKS